MRTFLLEACENIDAALFSGDEFTLFENRNELREYIARWSGRLDELSFVHVGECTDLKPAEK